MSWLASYYPPLEKTTVVAVETVRPAVSARTAEPVQRVVERHYMPSGEMNLGYIIENKPPRKTVIEYLRNFVEKLENSDSE
jgi:hypothetical protein